MNNEKLDAVKKEIKEKQISSIKDIIKDTFKKIHALEKDKNSIQNQIKILKHDLFDLKDGRLDRIVERQGMDELTKSISVLSVEKIEQQSTTNPWYIEYLIKYTGGEAKFNNSITKMHAAGSYKLEDGTVKYL